MLLEYFKPETFTSFHDIQAGNNGTLPILEALEKSPSSTSDNEQKKETAKLTSEQRVLSEDSWIMEWINSEPKLANQNLQSYFYFSRDKLTITAVNLQRMTPKAQEVIQKLLSDSKAMQTTAISAIQPLSSSEAASIFEALTQKIRQEENISGESRAFKGLFELAREKPDLKSQLITLLTKFPENNLPLSVTTLTEALLKESNSQAMLDLFRKWAKSSNHRLATLAKKKLKWALPLPITGLKGLLHFCLTGIMMT